MFEQNLMKRCQQPLPFIADIVYVQIRLQHLLFGPINDPEMQLAAMSGAPVANLIADT